MSRLYPGHEAGTASDVTSCQAFHEGIPLESLTDQVYHRRLYPGDNGLLYAPMPGTDTSEMDEGILEELDPTAKTHDPGLTNRW